MRRVGLMIRENVQQGIYQGRHDAALNQRFGLREQPVR